jgi:hypothetical protein
MRDISVIKPFLLDTEGVIEVQVDETETEAPRNACSLVTRASLSLHSLALSTPAAARSAPTRDKHNQTTFCLVQSTGRVEEDSLGRMDEEPDELMRD